MRSIKGWVKATFILTFLVIIAGGVVRTTQSGMGCPDFPTCFGMWIPPTNASELPPDFEKYLKAQDIDHTFNVYHTWIEYFNRLFGASLGLFAIIQTTLLYRRRKEDRCSYRLALAFLIMVILTGLLGAIVVKLNLAHASISLHLLFAVVLAQLQLALLLSISKKVFAFAAHGKLKKMMIAFMVIIFIQSILGTTVRMYVDDVSKILHYDHRDTWLADSPVTFLVHRSFSWLVLASALFMAWYWRKAPVAKKKLFLIAAMVVLSMITGIVLFKLDMPAIAQPLHLLLASVAITLSFSVLLQVKKVK